MVEQRGDSVYYVEGITDRQGAHHPHVHQEQDK